MNKIELRNENEIKNQLATFEEKAAYFQKFVDDFQKLKIGSLTTEDLQELFLNPRQFLTNRIAEHSEIDLGKFAFDKDKLFEIIQKPKGMDELEESISKYLADRYLKQTYNVAQYSISENKVIINLERRKAIENAHTVQVETELQQEIYKNVNTLCENLNNLKTLLGGRLTIEQLENSILKRAAQKNNQPTKEHADFIINELIIKKYNK